MVRAQTANHPAIQRALSCAAIVAVVIVLPPETLL
jgi:hypothetical protein